jgi:hypothetical protein
VAWYQVQALKISLRHLSAGHLHESQSRKPLSERTIRGKEASTERCLYLSSLLPDAQRMNQSVRLGGRVENSLHGCMDVVLGDDQMRAHGTGMQSGCLIYLKK